MHFNPGIGEISRKDRVRVCIQFFMNLKFLLSFGLALVTSPVYADSQSQCLVSTLKALSGQLSDAELFTAEEVKQIHEWALNPKVSNQKFNEYVFNAYVERRLKLLPAQDQQEIVSMIQKYEIEYSDHLNGFFRSGDNKISVTAPNLRTDQGLSRLILAHEVEHAIQYHFMRKYPKEFMNKSLLGVLHPKHVPLKFNLEKGAITAEWQYIKNIPKESRDAMIDEVLSLPRLTEGTKKTAVRILSNADLPLEDYLKKEWSSGRYSYEGMAWSATKRRTILVGLPTTFGVVMSCRSLQKKYSPKERAEMLYYKTICKGIYSQ